MLVVIGVVCLLELYICYADDIVLLAPCPSALRIMLKICDKYAHDFNAYKYKNHFMK